MPETPPPPPQNGQHQPGGPWWFRPFLSLFSMNAEQQRGAVAMIYMTVFLAGGGWLVYYFVTDSRRAENERTALFVRTFENENEKGRQAITHVVESNQRISMELGKFTARVDDLARLIQDSQQREKQLMTALAESRQINKEMAGILLESQRQNKEMAGIIAELRKKPPPNEVYFAPQPRLKDAIPLTGPVIG